MACHGGATGQQSSTMCAIGRRGMQGGGAQQHPEAAHSRWVAQVEVRVGLGTGAGREGGQQQAYLRGGH